jgi:hypothetical protein
MGRVYSLKIFAFNGMPITFDYKYTQSHYDSTSAGKYKCTCIHYETAVRVGTFHSRADLQKE